MGLCVCEKVSIRGLCVCEKVSINGLYVCKKVSIMGLYVCEKVSIMGLILIIIEQLTPKNTKESITLEPCFIIKERYSKKLR